MAVHLAVKTQEAIEQVMEADQGSSYRGNLGKVIGHMGDAYRTGEDGFRSHLGASVIGGNCGRAIWYGFRWATKPKFQARVLRLFNRGHLEEARFIAVLLTIGCEVFQQDEKGNQFRISDFGGHFGGSGDGVAKGIPDLPADTYALLEFKTHNDKSFKNLKATGVREAKFEHFVQMQVYMRKMGLAVALYGAVNKNDDELYFELVPLDTMVGDQFVERARTIIPLKVAPSKLNESPGWYECKWCDHNPICHRRALPATNCRTCDHSFAHEDGNWYCEAPNLVTPAILSKEKQLKGCESYTLNRTFG